MVILSCTQGLEDHPFVQPASLLLLMILIRVLGTSGLPGLCGATPAREGRNTPWAYWRICPRISRISYPYLRLSCAFPIHGRMCLYDPPTSTPAEEEKAQEPTIRPDLGASPPAMHPLRFALLQLAKHGASCDLNPVRSHTEAQVPRAVRCDQARDSHAQTGDPDAGGRCRRHRRVLGGARQRRHQQRRPFLSVARPSYCLCAVLARSKLTC